ncbi:MULTISPECIES: MinD/ParA family protein [Bacillus]|uniref:MinD/ParA family protein n=1 Tax=Bacillus TaxID=1386 RepID=UPI001D0CF822|nr:MULTISPECIES: MinD/ParA family protein [Bacillus]
MKDQAFLLRENMNKKKKEKKEDRLPHTIAVISGKGGVGKSNVSLNFALTMQKYGKSVLLIDLDIGMANIDVLLGSTQKLSIVDFFLHNYELKHLIQKGPHNLSFIAGGSGLTNVFQVEKDKVISFLLQLQTLTNQYDYIIFDMGAGITEENLQLLLSMNEIFLVTTGEPTSLTDAYSALKIIAAQSINVPFQVIINRALNEKNAVQTFQRLSTVSKRFIKKDLTLLGFVPDDKYVMSAVMEQKPFTIIYPSCIASKAINDITKRYLQLVVSSSQKNNTNFVSKLFQFFLERKA